jgi:hypothetical protein
MLENVEATAVHFALVFRGGGSMGFGSGVVKLEREDGKSVDHEAGGLGVEGRGIVLLAGLGEEEVVDLFDEVVAALVEAVNGVFDVGDGGVGGLWAAGVIFLVPEVEVGVMVGEDESGERVGTRIDQVRGGFVAVPEVGGLVLHPEDRVGFEHEWFWQETRHA